MTASAGPARPAAAPGAVRSPASFGDRAVLVPVKSFAEAKTRLGDVMGDTERRALVQQMAERVLAAAAPLPVAVVCDDRAVATWARQRGALVIWEPGRGLNGAVEAGVERLGEMGVEHVTVAHGDLPMATGIGGLEPFDGVTLVPDRHGNGTNVIRLPVGCGFRFSYGPGSFERHQRECVRLGVPVQILLAPALAHDVDLPDDLSWAP